MFQKTIISKYLKTQNKENLIIQWDLFCAHFHNHEIQENIRNSKEEQYQEGFLRDLFVKIFGYTLNPTIGFNLTTEYKNIKDSKKADGAIIIDENVVGVIELKGTNTTDLGKVEEQAFNYKNNQTGCKYVITSNFEKIRLYIDDSVRFVEFNLFTLQKDDFNLLYLLLSFDNIKNDIPNKLKDESLNQEDIVTKKLYKDYSIFKRELFQNLTLLNPEYDPLLLFQKSQKLLDRLLFLLFGEDRGLLPPNSVRQILEQWDKLKDLDAYDPLYNRYKKYFGYLNTGFKGKNHDVFAYNGGLFKEDEILDQIKIDDDLLYQHTFRLSQYDFASEVDVNILGHIFENSLNEIDEIKAQLDGTEIDKSKTKRKKDGVFYTPKYITKYIVENTVGKLCEEKKTEFQIVEEDYFTDKKRQQKTKENLLGKLDQYRSWLLQITIVDPACGSGAFLNEALNFLIEEHQYVDELEAKLLNVPIIFSYHSESILEHNLFGVDLNEESVEIAKLSLWLRTAEPNRKLNSLNDNIKCGNSLIDDPDVAGDKAFNWEREFPQVFSKGGFDVIVGNPPYVDVKSLDKIIVKHLFEIFKTANNRINLYSSFIEKSVNLLNNEGVSSLIIPSSLLTQESYKDLRKLLLKETTIQSIVRLPNESFGGGSGEVKVDTIILTFKAEISTESSVEIIAYKGFDRISEISSITADLHSFIDPLKWKNDDNFLFRINVDNLNTQILNRCQVDTLKLVDCVEFCLGLTPYDKYKGHSQDQIKDRVFHSVEQKDLTFRKLLAGNDIRRYNVTWGEKEWISYGKWLGAPREKKFFTDKRILVKQIIDWSDKRIWAALTTEELYNSQNAFNLIPKDGYQAEYLIAVINSKLMSFYHKKQFLEEFKDRFQKILIKDAKEFPIKKLSPVNQTLYVEKTNLMLRINKELVEISGKFQRTLKREFSIESLSNKLQSWYQLSYDDFLKELKKQKVELTLSRKADWEQYFDQEKNKAIQIQSQITSTDQEIDRMVYELYGLTEEEIAIVEKGLI
ncbi:Eco57I restriction-modification methylase domain-containing protein [Kaistella antarctica]|uniref:site-specific DNA-methyltransferase (adenine-specific) n=1 Tax=Kaistella antarctica TaxID=266748 RepID=A0A448NUV0_9FLAO|nr:N-6 DNA methylase [Kaistella antarctica]KEY20344.1 restriction endonuclease subunit M [Kaistella antarctica]SEV90763.1 TaqI-like C-terminal specificity domain-containing protein [Kaistella antarctica]VEI01525.1 Type IIS restriction enzyme Eco57I [Kaistella antarctica]